MADRVIRAGEQEVLMDDDGQAYNEAGQRLDDHGLIHPEDINEDQARLNAQLAARNVAGLCVEQHPLDQNEGELGVQRPSWVSIDTNHRFLRS